MQDRKKLIEVARDAIRYAKKYVKASSTAPGLTLDEIHSLRQQVAEARKREISLHEKVMDIYRLSTTDPDSLLNQLDWVRYIRGAKKHHFGNCDELCFLSLRYLRKQNISAEKLHIVTGDHIFIVIGRNRASQLNDPYHWGDNAVIFDPLMERIFFPNEIEQQLSIYCFNDSNKANPNQFNPYVIGEHRFRVREKTSVSFEKKEKQRIIDERNTLLKILYSIKPTTSLVLLSANNFIDDTTNDVERRTFKPIRQQIKAIPDNDYETLLFLLIQRLNLLRAQFNNPLLQQRIINWIFESLSNDDFSQLLKLKISLLPEKDQKYCIGFFDPDASVKIALAALKKNKSLPTLVIQIPLLTQNKIYAYLQLAPEPPVIITGRYYQDDKNQLYWQGRLHAKESTPVASITEHLMCCGAKLLKLLGQFNVKLDALKTKFIDDVVIQKKLISLQEDFINKLNEASNNFNLADTTSDKILKNILMEAFKDYSGGPEPLGKEEIPYKIGLFNAASITQTAEYVSSKKGGKEEDLSPQTKHA